jgi:hypothetical protein
VSFFKELPVVLNKLRPWLSDVSPNAENVDGVLRLREWQETLVSLTQLSNKYKVCQLCSPMVPDQHTTNTT